MQESLKKELIRKGIHLFSLSIPIGTYLLRERIEIAISILSIVFLLFVIAEVLRFVSPVFKLLFVKFFGYLLREHESTKLTGSTYLLFSSLACIIIFKLEISIAAITFLVLGDTAAALVGKHWGKHKIINKKTLEGSSAFFLLCIISSFFIPQLTFAVALAGAITATLVELFFPPKFIDDNLSIPFFSALIMTFI